MAPRIAARTSKPRRHWPTFTPPQWPGFAPPLTPFNAAAYKRRNLIERAFSRLKDFRRVHTRYDRLAVTYDATVCLAAVMTWWL